VKGVWVSMTGNHNGGGKEGVTSGKGRLGKGERVLRERRREGLGPLPPPSRTLPPLTPLVKGGGLFGQKK